VQTKTCSKEDKYFKFYSAPLQAKEEGRPQVRLEIVGCYGELEKRCSSIQISYLARISSVLWLGKSKTQL